MRDDEMQMTAAELFDPDPQPTTVKDWLATVYHQNRAIKKDMEDVKREVRKTNGRVTELENWRNRAFGAIAVLLAIGVPLFLTNVAK